ncbi:nucleotidyltransferase family protein [Marinobacter sp. VGCF2001]|uniref:nucleotidyltransferase family protein n=1 Tax=Marinobacter sp. VGCF2001 TaxID=3417189 RepID=UPI003CF9773B
MALPEPSSAKTPFGLPPQVIKSLQGVFSQHHAIERVTLYGSRAKGNYRPNSDIDLLLTAPALPWQEFNQIELEIDDLLLPWKVDLALKHQVENEELLKHVDRVGIPLF